MTRLIMLTFGVVLWSTSAIAQTVLNPTRVEFTPSADHAIVIDGVALVESYEFRFYLAGASSPIQVVNIGKPTPSAQNVCSAAIPARPFSPTTQYVGRVAALGPTGVGESTNSNPFYFVGLPGSPANVTLKGS